MSCVSFQPGGSPLRMFERERRGRHVAAGEKEEGKEGRKNKNSKCCGNMQQGQRKAAQKCEEEGAMLVAKCG